MYKQRVNSVGLEKTPTGAAGYLVLDGEALDLNYRRHMFEKLGYTVIEADTGETAVKIYQKHMQKTAVVLLDLATGKTGYSTEKPNPTQIDVRVKIVLLSETAPTDRVKSLVSRQKMPNPFDLELLLGEINSILDP